MLGLFLRLFLSFKRVLRQTHLSARGLLFPAGVAAADAAATAAAAGAASPLTKHPPSPRTTAAAPASAAEAPSSAVEGALIRVSPGSHSVSKWLRSGERLVELFLRQALRLQIAQSQNSSSSNKNSSSSSSGRGRGAGGREQQEQQRRAAATMAYSVPLQWLRRAACVRGGGCVSLPCLWGLLLLSTTVLLWTLTAYSMQELLLSSYPRPLFATLVQSACPLFFLLPPAAAALRSSKTWRRGDAGGDRQPDSREPLKAPIWQVALAGFLAQNAQTLTVDSCLRLLQQQQQQQDLQQRLEVSGAGRGASMQLSRISWLWTRFWRRLRGRGRARSCCSSSTAAAREAAAAAAEQQPVLKCLDLMPPAWVAGSCERSLREEDEETGLPCVTSASRADASRPSLCLWSLDAAAAPGALSRRACAAEGCFPIAAAAGASSSSSSSTGCSSSRSSDEGSSPGGALTVGIDPWDIGGCCGCVESAAAADAAEASAAAREFQVRMGSFKRSLPLTVVWLVAQLSYDASLPLLSLTTSAVVQSTSVFFCYLLAIVTLHQAPRRSVLSWLVILAGGVCLITSHIPSAPDATLAAAAAAGGGSDASASFAAASPPQQLLLQELPLDLPSSEEPAQQLLQGGGPAAAARAVPAELPWPEAAAQPAAAAATTAAAAPAAAATAAKAPAAATATAAPAAASDEASEATVAASTAAAASAAGGGASAATELHEATDTLLGYVLCFLAAVAYAVHTTALKAQEMRDPDFDVGLVYGLMGLWVFVALPVLTLLIHVCRIEAFVWPSGAAWTVLLLCGFVGTALADICWGRAVFLLNPVVASAAANMQIPLSLLADAVVLGRSFDWWYVLGMTAVLAAVVAVTIITTEPPRHKKASNSNSSSSSRSRKWELGRVAASASDACAVAARCEGNPFLDCSCAVLLQRKAYGPVLTEAQSSADLEF
ncbi:hypothetical protein Esti_000834 [Eimeria stiedai]